MLETAKHCKQKIAVDDRKMSMLKLLDLGIDLETVFTTAADATGHAGAGVASHHQEGGGAGEACALPIRHITWSRLGKFARGGWTFYPDYPMLHEMLKANSSSGFTRISAFVPTGWTYQINKVRPSLSPFHMCTRGCVCVCAFVCAYVRCFASRDWICSCRKRNQTA